MREEYIGDSYDFVKQSFLRWLGGEWSVHPMFTEQVSDQGVEAYTAVLRNNNNNNIEIISRDELNVDRDGFCAAACNVPANLFLDPDTGLTLNGGNPGWSHLTAAEIVKIVVNPVRTEFLTMVFDQSIDRNAGEPQQQTLDKLNYLQGQDVYAFAYVSHSCLIVASGKQGITQDALRRVRNQSRLPCKRLILSPAII